MPTKGQRRFERRLAARREVALIPAPRPAIEETLDLDARLRRALGNKLPLQRQR